MAQTGLDGRWLRVNRRLASMLGFSSAELEATDFAALTHPEDVEENVVESHISKLRKKLRERLGYDPIDSKRFLGYRLEL